MFSEEYVWFQPQCTKLAQLNVLIRMSSWMRLLLFFFLRVVVQHDYSIYADVRTYDDVMWCRVGATIISRRISADTTEYVVAKEADETTALIDGPDDDMSDYILPAPEFK